MTASKRECGPAIIPPFARILFEEIDRGSNPRDLLNARGPLVAQMAVDVVNAAGKPEHQTDLLAEFLRLLQDSLAMAGHVTLAGAARR
jgi:hypothetical protein